MKRFAISVFVSVAALCGCSKFDIPVIGEYKVYSVDINELSGLCMNKDKTYLLSCGDKGVIKSISFNGETQDIWTMASDMEGITSDPTTGDVYLAIEGLQEVHKLAAPAFSSQTRVFAVKDAVDGYYDNSGLEAVEYYEDGVLFVGSQKGANLWQYDLDGTMLSNVSLSSFASEIAGLCYEPETGWLWVTDSKKSKIFICNPNGTLIASYDISFIDNAESICVDRSRGYVWVGSDEDDTKLYRFDFKF